MNTVLSAKFGLFGTGIQTALISLLVFHQSWIALLVVSLFCWAVSLMLYWASFPGSPGEDRE